MDKQKDGAASEGTAQRLVRWEPIETAPKTGREKIELLLRNGNANPAYSNTWWVGGFPAGLKPTHWRYPPNDKSEQTGKAD